MSHPALNLHFVSLRQHLENPASPLRQAFTEHLPRLAASMRSTWKPAMAGSEPIQAPDGQPADILGHAISERLVWTRTPLSTPASPLLGADLLLSAGASSSVICALDTLAADPAPENTDRAARAAVLIGLLDRAVRNGSALAEAWYEPLFTAASLDDALATVPGSWVADLRAVTERSAPLMASLQGSVTPGPTFTGSRAVGGADADLIIGSCVVEIKATRAPDLRLRDAQQVIGYALLDFDDTYGLAQVAVLSARYGRLIVWDLEELLDQAGGLGLAQARSQIADALAVPL